MWAEYSSPPRDSSASQPWFVSAATGGMVAFIQMNVKPKALVFLKDFRE